MIFEMLIFAIHSPILLDLTFNINHRISPSMNANIVQSAYGSYSLDQVLTFLAILKTYFIAKLVPLITSVTADNSRKINDIKGLLPDFQFYLNVSLIERPLPILILAIFYVAIFFGVSIDFMERNQTLVNPKTGQY